MNCYNCGKPLENLSRKEKDREHIPAQNLFEGLGDEYKTNRIKVPSCRKCNKEYSKITDEEFRNLIGVVNNKPILSQLTAKTIRSFKRDYNKRTRITDKGTLFDFSFVDKYHIKNFKGLFYYEYEYTISNDEYIVLVNRDENDKSKELNNFILYLTKNFNWKHSGHPDVFKYILQPFRENYKSTELKDITPIEKEPYFLCLMVYNKTHAALVLATNK